MLKKAMVAACAGMMAMSLVACGGDDAAKATDDSAVGTQEQVDEGAATETNPDAVSGEASALDSEFKAALDEYESFMDGYIEFMSKYNESDDVAAMLADYTKWMGDYADMAEKIEAIDDEALNADEAAYYAEVTTRVADKLADAGVNLQ